MVQATANFGGPQAPAGTPNNNALYLDTSTTPATLWAGIAGVWVAIAGPSVALGVYTVATLHAAPVKGQRAFVTDANATFTAGIGAVVACSGANNVPVTYDGTNWRIG